MNAPLDNRPTLHYRGEVPQSQLGQIVGPNGFGELYVFAEITYDPDWLPITHCGLRTIHSAHDIAVLDDSLPCPGGNLGRSTVRLRNATQPEVEDWQRSVTAMSMAMVNPA